MSERATCCRSCWFLGCAVFSAWSELSNSYKNVARHVQQVVQLRHHAVHPPSSCWLKSLRACGKYIIRPRNDLKTVHYIALPSWRLTQWHTVTDEFFVSIMRCATNFVVSLHCLSISSSAEIVYNTGQYFIINLHLYSCRMKLLAILVYGSSVLLP